MKTQGFALSLLLAPFCISGIGAPDPSTTPVDCLCEYGYIMDIPPGGGVFIVDFEPESLDGICTPAQPPCATFLGCYIDVSWYFVTPPPPLPPAPAPTSYEVHQTDPWGVLQNFKMAEPPQMRVGFDADCGNGYTWYFPEIGQGGQSLVVMCTHCQGPN